MSIRIRFLRNYEGIGCGETRIFPDRDAEVLIAAGIVAEVLEIKPAGPKEIKPIEPSEFKEAFGKKKVKTPKSSSQLKPAMPTARARMHSGIRG